MTATDAVPVSPSNREQLRAWDGGEGAYWAANADRDDRAVETYHHALLDAAAIGAADRVLDIGCGTGQTTRDAARRAPDGSALGVDLSAAMLAEARSRAAVAGVGNVEFLQADAQIHPFEPETCDPVISRTGTMFFGDIDAAFANIARALRPGGRLALVTWRSIEGNEWIREFTTALAAGRDMKGPPPGAPGPFAMSESDHVQAVLGGAGFTDVDLAEMDSGTWFGEDAPTAHRFVLDQLGRMLEGLDDAARTEALDALLDTVRRHETPEGVLFDSAAWIITASRSASVRPRHG